MRSGFLHRVFALLSYGVALSVCMAFAGDGPPAKAPVGSFAGTKAGQTRNDNELKTPLVWIPPSRFTMGSPKNEKGYDSENQVRVTLTKGFWLGQHEVTQAEWQQVMQTTPWSFRTDLKQGPDYPATHVSWNDAMTFCEKLTEAERQAGRLPADWHYTLPTEAQWEYACRGGTKSRYSFGDDEADLGNYAWFAKNADDVGERYPHPVARKKANPLGLYDMHGNVWEWCQDYHSDELVGGTDPQGPASGSFKVTRGGSWNYEAWYCRSALRLSWVPSIRDGSTGFRVAVVAK